MQNLKTLKDWVALCFLKTALQIKSSESKIVYKIKNSFKYLLKK